MMTGQPYKSPEQAADTGASTGTEGTQASIVGSVAAFRGVSNVSALLKRQRETNKVFKDAWLEIDPTLKGSLSPGEIEQVATRAGLTVTADDVKGMIDPTNGEGKITCEPSTTFSDSLSSHKTTEVLTLGIMCGRRQVSRVREAAGG